MPFVHFRLDMEGCRHKRYWITLRKFLRLDSLVGLTIRVRLSVAKHQGDTERDFSVMEREWC
jgi:hypothetical protein